jgi:ribose transport system permease protein
MSESWMRWRSRLVPDHVVGEILSKSWIDNAIPFLLLLISIAVFSPQIPDFFAAYSLQDNSRLLGELLLVVLGETIVILAGGIDLSVGATFAMATFASLGMFNAMNWPVAAVVAGSAVIGALIGLVNGLLIGYLRLRAFLTTLVTLIIVRAIFDTLSLKFQVMVSTPTQQSPVWDFLGNGSVGKLPFALIVAACACLLGHITLTRLRLGWHVQAIGGARRSAYNAGISVGRTVCMTYVLSGILAAISGTFYASRLGAAGSDTGSGLEVAALTAAVLGGISLGGGRGSVVKGVLGAIVVTIVQTSLTRTGMGSGAGGMILGLLLLIAVAVDVKWLKNRLKVLAKVYVSPGYLALPAAEDIGVDSAYAMNDKLSEVELIGLGEVEGPEDVILDDEGNLYCGSRHGDIVRFMAPDHKRWEIYAHIGGHPLGHAFDAEGNLIVCVSGMGLYKVSADRQIVKLSDETNRSWFSVIDDSRMRLADDLDIAPDGRIYFSEATIRFDVSEWMVDALEARPNGRIICYDPRDRSTRTVIPKLLFPNGVCMTHDGQSFLFAETWGCTITRYWFDGPEAGRRQVIMPNLPGYPDNINRASDGNYWCAFVGMRAPTFDLAMRMPGFRKRMVQRLPHDDWIYPNMNAGCVIKFDVDGNVLDCLWDRTGANHPMITSMREHRGYLYLGGSLNNRIGKWRIPGADPKWTGRQSYWGEKKSPA